MGYTIGMQLRLCYGFITPVSLKFMYWGYLIPKLSKS